MSFQPVAENVLATLAGSSPQGNPTVDDNKNRAKLQDLRKKVEDRKKRKQKTLRFSKEEEARDVAAESDDEHCTERQQVSYSAHGELNPQDAISNQTC